ncbi:MAG: hypothetical protein ABGX05_09285 [Pirellulaceae bacterium]
MILMKNVSREASFLVVTSRLAASQSCYSLRVMPLAGQPYLPGASQGEPTL